MAQPVTAEATLEMRAQLRALIRHAQTEAAREGKPLTILLGEQHGYQTSWFNNILAVDEARKLGINIIGFEASSSDDIHWRKEIPGSLAENADQFSMAALFPSMKETPIEKNRDALSSRNSMELRDANMAKNIAALNAPSISIVGSAHLLGIQSDSALKNHHVLLLNVEDDPLKQYRMISGPRADFSLTSPNVHRLDIAGDARENSAQELIKLAFPLDTKQKIEALDLAGYAISKSKLLEIKNIKTESVELLITRNPSIAANFLLSSAHALQELSHSNPGLKAEAIQAFKQAYTICPEPDTWCKARISVSVLEEPEEIRNALPFSYTGSDNQYEKLLSGVKWALGIEPSTDISGTEHLEKEIEASLRELTTETIIQPGTPTKKSNENHR